MEIVDRRIPLADIGKTVGSGPVERFIESVRRHGILVPVVVRELVSDEGEVGFSIIDGNRRVASARLLGHDDILARVISGISADDAARLTLLGNNFRSANDITEFWAIKQLERSGHSRQRVADDAGISVRYLDSRNRWSRLDRRVFVGLAEGRIPASVANKISRMAPHEQRELGDLFDRKGRILTGEVEAVAKRRRTAHRGSANDVPHIPQGGTLSDPLPSVTIVSVPVEVGTKPAPSGHGAVSDELLASIEAVARRGLAEHIDLPELTNVLAIAYRHAKAMASTAGE